MILSILVNWFVALGVSRAESRSARAKALLAVAVTANVLILFVAKYLTFVLGVIDRVGGVGFDVPFIPLPIGISFFTFQAMSYVIDVYRGEPVQRSVLNVAFYISFFPQLVAGAHCALHHLCRPDRKPERELAEVFFGHTTLRRWAWQEGASRQYLRSHCR